MSRGFEGRDREDAEGLDNAGWSPCFGDAGAGVGGNSKDKHLSIVENRRIFILLPPTSNKNW